MRGPLAYLLILGILLSALPSTALAARPLTSACTFRQGFEALHDLIPDVVGACVTDEEHNPDNGDSLQQTTRGLLVWRKADNWTAFTDGVTTWINGPCGLQARPNDQRFTWEQGGPCDVASQEEPPVQEDPPAQDPPPVASGHPWPNLEQQVFGLINRDRQANGLPPLAWDQVASDAGLPHALEMARAGYTAHLDLAGLLPQQRYTRAGGRDYVAENAACVQMVHDQAALELWVERTQQLIMAETPPNDGHRRNILNPDRNAAGVAVAWEGGWLCLTQELLNRYVTLEGVPAEAWLSQTLHLSGRAVAGYSVSAIGLGYLSPATPLTVAELTAIVSYQEADVYAWLPVAIDAENVFRADITLDHTSGPGRYQIFVWVKDAADRQVLAANPIVDVR